jgi:antitoxin MazE
MKTISSVGKWGNSLAVRIPSSVVQDLGLSENTSVQIDSDGHVAIMKPKKVKQVSLGSLVDKITPENRYTEIDWGKPMGKEVW